MGQWVPAGGKSWGSPKLRPLGTQDYHPGEPTPKPQARGQGLRLGSLRDDSEHGGENSAQEDRGQDFRQLF